MEQTPGPPSHDRIGDLLAVLSRIAISVEMAPTLEALLDALRDLIPFSAGGIFVVDAGRHVLRAAATRGYPAGLEVPFGAGVVGTVIRSARPRLVPDVRCAEEYVEARASTRAQLAVPLLSARGVIGAISLEHDQRDAFTEQDVGLVTLFGQQAAVAIERATLHEQLLRQSLMRREIEVAAEIVRGLAPATMPQMPGIDVHGRSSAAGSVGGDAFDLLEYADGQLGVSIADPRGKGMPAALLAVAYRSTLRAFVSTDLRLQSMFSRMSQLIEQSMPAGAFITAFYGILEVHERRMVYANAAHPPGLVLRADGVTEWLLATGAPLGVPQGGIKECYVNFRPGDGLVLFTDGVTEAGSRPDAFFDLAGIEAAAREKRAQSAAEIGDGILEAAAQHAGGRLNDDATVVVLKFIAP